MTPVVPALSLALALISALVYPVLDRTIGAFSRVSGH
jgi:hypothetical protein